jgi:chromosome segregation ATPase
MYLFRLHGVARQFDEANQKRQQTKEDRQRHREDIEGGRHGLEVAERERAQVHLHVSQADRAVAAVRAKLEKLNPEKVAVSTKLTFTQQRIEDLQRNVAREDRKTDKYQTQIAALRAEEEKLIAEESQIAEHLAKGELCFTRAASGI